MQPFDNYTDSDFHLDFYNHADFWADLLNEPPSWKFKEMSQWTSHEVIDFLRSKVACLPNFPCRVSLEKFSSVSGFIFQTLSIVNCSLLCNSVQGGEIIYRVKEDFNSQHQINCQYNCDQNCNTKVCPEFQFIQSQDDRATSRRPGRPRTRIQSDKADGKRSQKIWQFLIHLLKDANTCPNLVKWEDPAEGTFKFVQTEKVAKLWGSRKSNNRMTYEKFSRAMRYYYKSKVLLPVPGKRLVYKFGPQAKGWELAMPVEL